MRKGLEMTMSTLLALAIVLIVLLSVVAILTGTVPGISNSLGCDADFRMGCNSFIAAGGCKEDSDMVLVETATQDNYVSMETTECVLGSVSETRARELCCRRPDSS